MLRLRSRGFGARARSTGASRGPRPRGSTGRRGRPRPSGPRWGGSSRCRRRRRCRPRLRSTSAVSAQPAGLVRRPGSRRSPTGSTCAAGVVPERREPGVVVGLHDVRDPQADDRDPGSPVELGRERLAGELRQGVARLRARLDGLVDRRELPAACRTAGRGRSRSTPRRRAAAGSPRPRRTRCRSRGRCCGTFAGGRMPGRGIAARWTTASEPASGLGGLAVVREVGEQGVAVSEPSWRVSTLITSWPWSRRSLTTHRPALPLPPVTTIRIAAPASVRVHAGRDLGHRRSRSRIDGEPEHVRAVVVAGGVEVPPR